MSQEINAQHMRAMGLDPSLLGQGQAVPKNLHRVVRQKVFHILSVQPVLVEQGAEQWAREMSEIIADAVVGAME